MMRVIPGPAGKAVSDGSSCEHAAASPALDATTCSVEERCEQSSAWRAAHENLRIDTIQADGNTGLGDVQAAHGMAFQKVCQLLVLVQKMTVAASGDVYAELMDTSGCIGAAVCKAVVQHHPEFIPGSAVVLKNVSWVRPGGMSRYCIEIIPQQPYAALDIAPMPYTWCAEKQVFPPVVRASLRAAKQLAQPTICGAPGIASVDQHTRSRAKIVNANISNTADMILQQLGPPSEQPSAARSCLQKSSASTASGQAAAEMCTEPVLAGAISSAVEPQHMTAIRLAECDEGFDPDDSQATEGLAPDGQDDPSEDLDVDAEAPSFEFMATDAVHLSTRIVNQNIPEQLGMHNPSQHHLPSSALFPQKSRLRQLLLDQDDNIELEE